MNKTHHPRNRAERLKIKFKKLLKRDRPDPSRKKGVEEVKTKEADNALRKHLYGIQEEDYE